MQHPPEHSDLVASQQGTERQHSELETAYDSAPIGLCVVDTDLRYVLVNARLAEMNGWPARDHIGRTVREIVPFLADQTEPMLRTVIESGQPRVDVEIFGETAAQPGVSRIRLEQWHPLRDRNGAVTGISIVAEEVTEEQKP